jgi:flagellar hook-length control protein FliK
VGDADPRFAADPGRVPGDGTHRGGVTDNGHGDRDDIGSSSPASGPAPFANLITHGTPSNGNLAQMAGPAHAHQVATHTPGSPQFGPEIAQHVTWLAGNGVQTATIQVSPPNLGPIHVQVAHHHNLVDVRFVVQNPQTAQALQQSLPQLNQMLTQQGLSMGQATVGQQASGQRQGGNQEAQSEPVSALETGAGEVGLPARPAVARGRVDEFA